MQGRQSQATRLNGDDLLQLAEIAWLYYGQELTQEQIARKTGLSRPTISRMLKDARDRRIIEFRIHYPYQTVRALEDAFCTRLGLDACQVLATADSDAVGNAHGVPHRVGALAARFLQEVIPDQTIIGLGWGTMVWNFVSSGYLTDKRDITVAQIQGSVGGATPDLDGAWLATSLGRALGARVHTLSAPMVVADVSVKTGLLRDEHIRTTLEVGKRADTLIVGIGAVSHKSGLYRAGYLNDADLTYIRDQGAVGDVCGSYFSREGVLCPLELNDRTIAQTAEAMVKAPKRVGISAGLEKALPNIGACRSRLINMLITDQQTALEMLRLIDQEDSSMGRTRDTKHKL